MLPLNPIQFTEMTCFSSLLSPESTVSVVLLHNDSTATIKNLFKNHYYNVTQIPKLGYWQLYHGCTPAQSNSPTAFHENVLAGFRMWLYLRNKSTLPANIVNLTHSKQNWAELITPQTTMSHEKAEHSLKPKKK